MKLLDKPFVAVRWADAHTSGSTEYAEHELPHRAAHYTTYGFLMREDAEGLSLIGEHSDEHGYRSHNFIPAVLVVEIIHLTLTKKRAAKRPIETN
jgi:hypothetical protein